MAALGLGTTATAQTPADLAGKYEGELYISLGEPITDETEALAGQSIDIAIAEKAGAVDFAIYNFGFGGMQLGDILLPAIGITGNEGVVNFAENPLVRLNFLDGAIVADANLDHLTSWIKGDSIYANINVSWIMSPEEQTPIYVRFVGKKFVDFQGFDGSFNGAWGENRPWDSEYGYFDWATAPEENWGTPAMPFTRDQLIQPEGWTISNVSGMNSLGATLVGRCDTIDAATPDYAVTITNMPNPFAELSGAIQMVPGFMTLGTSWATANGMEVLSGNLNSADGGSFGGTEFKNLPDAIALRYKRSHGADGNTEKASVIAYLWKGTYSQADVPGNTYLFGAPKTVTMIDRDRNILGMETTQGGEVTKSDDAACIASLVHGIEGDAAEWTDLTVDFDYGTFDGTGTLPEKMNIIISANDYFGDRAAIGNGNSLTVDDVRLVYYSTLKALAYEGEELEFAADKTSYDLSGVVYDASKLSFAKKGQGATVTTSYNEATAQLVVRVDGADIATNPANSTAYVVQFKAGSTGIAGIEAENGSRNAVYSISGVRVASKLTDDLPKGVYIVGGKKVVKK